MKARDLLITVDNTSVLDMGHGEVVKIIKTAQLDLELTIERYVLSSEAFFSLKLRWI